MAGTMSVVLGVSVAGDGTNVQVPVQGQTDVPLTSTSVGGRSFPINADGTWVGPFYFSAMAADSRYYLLTNSSLFPTCELLFSMTSGGPVFCVLKPGDPPAFVPCGGGMSCYVQAQGGNGICTITVIGT